MIGTFTGGTRCAAEAHAGCRACRGFLHSSICFRQIPEVLKITFREFMRFATRPSFPLFQHISQHCQAEIKSSPRLGLHHILSQIAFCLIVKFLVFKFHCPKLGQKNQQDFDMQIKSGKKHVLLLQELSIKRLAETQVAAQALQGKGELCPAQHTGDENGRRVLLRLHHQW